MKFSYIYDREGEPQILCEWEQSTVLLDIIDNQTMRIARYTAVGNPDPEDPDLAAVVLAAARWRREQTVGANG